MKEPADMLPNRLRVALSLMVFWLLSTVGVLAQTATPTPPPPDGLDLVFVLENTSGVQTSDPQNLQFEAVRYGLYRLGVDALLFNPGVQHRATVILYNSTGDTEASLTFGPYGANGITNPEAFEQFNADWDAAQRLLQFERPTRSRATEGLLNDVPREVSQALQASSANRPRQVILLAAGSPQAINPLTDIDRFLDAITPTLLNARFDVVLLPLPAPVAPNLGAWQAARGALAGTQTEVVDGAGMLAETIDLVEGALDSLRRAKGITVVAVTVEQGVLELPPFVSAVSFESLSEIRYTLTAPSALSQTISTFTGVRGKSDTYANPVPGTYRFSDSEAVKAYIRMGRLELDATNEMVQLGEAVVTSRVIGATGEPFDYGATFQPPLRLNVSHDQTSSTWSLPMNTAGQSGRIERRFVPPYAGNYVYRMDYNFSAYDQPLVLAAGDVSRSFNATALRLALNGFIRAELYQPIDLDFLIEGAGTTPLNGTPTLVITPPDAMRVSGVRFPVGASMSTTVPEIRFSAMAPQPSALSALVEASLPDQPDTTGATVYTAISATDFPIDVTQPAIASSLTSTNTMFETIDLSVTSPSLTTALLSDFGVRLCVEFSRAGEDRITALALNPRDAAFTSSEFVPRLAGSYRYQVSVRQQCDSAESVTAWEVQQFTVQELVLAFVGEDGRATALPTLQQFVPYVGRVSLLVGESNPQPYTGTLAVIPIVSLGGTLGENGQIGTIDLATRSYRIDVLSRLTGASDLRFTASDPDGQPLSVRFYDGAATIPATLGLQTTPVGLTLAMTHTSGRALRQFDTAQIRVKLTSGADYSANDFQRDGGQATLRLSAGELSWDVPLTFDSAADDLRADVPLPVGGAYNFALTLTMAGDSSRFDTVFTAQTVTQLDLTPADDMPTQVAEEMAQRFEFVWRDRATRAVVREDFDNPPTVRLELHPAGEDPTLRSVPSQSGSYLIERTFAPQSRGEYLFSGAWDVVAPSGRYTVELTPVELTVVGSIPFYIDLEAAPQQEFFTPYLPLVSPNIRTERALFYTVLMRPALDAQTPDRLGTIPLSSVLAAPVQQHFALLLEDASIEGECGLASSAPEAECAVPNDLWVFVVSPDGASAEIVLRGVTENKPYRARLKLTDTQVVQEGYFLRQEVSIAAPETVLVASPYTTLFPTLFLVITGVVTLAIIAGWLISDRLRDTRQPHLQHTLRFGDDKGRYLPLSKDMSEWRVNRKDLRRSELWDYFDLRRVVIERSKENDSDIVIKYWPLVAPSLPKRLSSWFTVERFNPPTIAVVQLNVPYRLNPLKQEFLHYQGIAPSPRPMNPPALTTPSVPSVTPEQPHTPTATSPNAAGLVPPSQPAPPVSLDDSTPLPPDSTPLPPDSTPLPPDSTPLPPSFAAPTLRSGSSTPLPPASDDDDEYDPFGTAGARKL
jgi:hypothetical protein